MIIFGASGHSKVVLDIIFANNQTVDVIVDHHPKVSELFGIRVTCNDEIDAKEEAIIAIGNNKTRKIISENYAVNYVTAFHPNSVISKYAKINSGTVVMANVVINPDAEVGRHCIINTSAVIEHDCKIGDFAHISPHAALAGNVSVGEGSHVGIGASVIQGVTIGKWATIGAGSVIIKDVPDFATVVGNPGRIIKINKNIQNNER